MLRSINDPLMHGDLVNLLYSKKLWQQKPTAAENKNSNDPVVRRLCDEYMGKIPEIKISNIGLCSAFTYCGGNKLKNVSLLRYQPGEHFILHNDRKNSKTQYY
jgi:hypothetical protein